MMMIVMTAAAIHLILVLLLSVVVMLVHLTLYFWWIICYLYVHFSLFNVHIMFFIFISFSFRSFFVSFWLYVQFTFHIFFISFCSNSFFSIFILFSHLDQHFSSFCNESTTTATITIEYEALLPFVTSFLFCAIVVYGFHFVFLYFFFLILVIIFYRPCIHFIQINRNEKNKNSHQTSAAVLLRWVQSLAVCRLHSFVLYFVDHFKSWKGKINTRTRPTKSSHISIRFSAKAFVELCIFFLTAQQRLRNVL